MAFPSPPNILGARDLRATELEQTPAEALLRIYTWMHYARVVDNRNLDLFRQGLMKGTLTGGQGNEGLIVPLALLADKSTDVVSFTHRDLGGHLIWSGHLCEHLNQYFANAASPTKAREGNIHHGDPANRSIPMISHLGAMCGVDPRGHRLPAAPGTEGRRLRLLRRRLVEHGRRPRVAQPRLPAVAAGRLRDRKQPLRVLDARERAVCRRHGAVATRGGVRHRGAGRRRDRRQRLRRALWPR